MTIKFNKEYWRLEDGKIKYYSTLGHYEPYEIVKTLNELENEKARLSYELWRLRRIKMNLEDIKNMIENIEMMEEREETIESILCLLLTEKQ